VASIEAGSARAGVLFMLPRYRPFRRRAKCPARAIAGLDPAFHGEATFLATFSWTSGSSPGVTIENVNGEEA